MLNVEVILVYKMELKNNKYKFQADIFPIKGLIKIDEYITFILIKV